jgi:CRP-like cAMP-binding protein
VAAGELLGEFGVVCGKNRSATVVCLDDTLALVMTAPDFLKFHSTNPDHKKQKADFLAQYFELSSIRLSNSDLFYSAQLKKFVYKEIIYN